MGSDNKINEFVRMRIRQLRKAKKLKIREMATRTTMPGSSYASLESGFYKINLDNLFRILGALDADIREVWPAESVVSGPAEARLYLQRLQQFRLGELISLCEVEGAALFAVEDGRCDVLLYQGVSDFLLDRLIFYLEDDVSYSEGIWFKKTVRSQDLHFFLKGDKCPDFISRLIEKYMTIWAEVYGHPQS